MNLHGAIVVLLGWQESDSGKFSLRALRDLVRLEPPSKRRDEILAEIDSRERSGEVLLMSTWR